MPQYAKNKKAFFEYDILDTIEAGLVLTGAEVKSIRNKHIKLTGSFVHIYQDEAYINNMHIASYKHAVQINYDPTQRRKLLLNRKEIAYLQGKSQEKGLTIIPLSVYTKGRHIKLEIAIARGKKSYDKKRVLKERDLNREAQRAIKDMM